MTQMIEVKDGIACLRAEIASNIAYLERIAKEVDEQKKAVRKAILDEMEAKGIVKIDTPDMVITYIAESDRENFDKKRFRSDHPEEYDSYVSISPVSATVKIKLKEQK